MARFLFIYRDPVTKQGPQLSADEMQTVMQSWWDWLGAGQAAGWVLEMGDPLDSSGKVVHADHSITDGPYVESKEMVGGYSIIQAGDYDQACELALGCPIYHSGGVVEVRQIVEVPES